MLVPRPIHIQTSRQGYGVCPALVAAPSRALVTPRCDQSGVGNARIPRPTVGCRFPRREVPLAPLACRASESRPGDLFVGALVAIPVPIGDFPSPDTVLLEHCCRLVLKHGPLGKAWEVSAVPEVPV